jgi:DNA invertase Pin-like site-specific DNA recombinase
VPIPEKSPSVAAEARKIQRETPENRFTHKVDCVLLLADGWSYGAVAKAFHHDPATVKRWWRKAKKQ